MIKSTFFKIISLLLFIGGIFFLVKFKSSQAKMNQHINMNELNSHNDSHRTFKDSNLTIKSSEKSNEINPKVEVQISTPPFKMDTNEKPYNQLSIQPQNTENRTFLFSSKSMTIQNTRKLFDNLLLPPPIPLTQSNDVKEKLMKKKIPQFDIDTNLQQFKFAASSKSGPIFSGDSLKYFFKLLDSIKK
jgi:hypothetical protein